MNIIFAQPPAPQVELPPPSFMDKLGGAIDSMIGVFNPQAQRERMQARVEVQRAQLSYASAYSGRMRSPAPPFQQSNSIMHQVDAATMMKRAEQQQRDNSFVNALVQCFVDFTVGEFEYIPNTKNRAVNKKYRKWLNDVWMFKADARGKHHFIEMVHHAYRGLFFHGNYGFVHHHGDNIFQLSAVPGKCIGNPQVPMMNPFNINGVVISEEGRVLGYELYKQTIYNQWVPAGPPVPNSIFSHLNPVESDDDFKNVTLLKTLLNDTHDMTKLDDAWMKKMQMLGNRVALINPTNGTASAPSRRNPNEGSQLDDESYNGPIGSRLEHVVPGEIMYGEPGTTMEVVRNETPTDQEMVYVERKMQLISNVLGIPLPFLWFMMTGSMQGTMARHISKRAERTFQQGRIGQKWLVRVFLREVMNKALMSGIVSGAIPFADDWTEGYVQFPAHPSLDSGNDSDSDLNENRQGIVARRELCGKRGRYHEDVDDWIKQEAESKFEDAIDLANRLSKKHGEEITWQQVMPHLQLMTPNGNEISGAEEKAGEDKETGDNPPQKKK